jgi:hypothetical protein
MGRAHIVHGDYFGESPKLSQTDTDLSRGISVTVIRASIFQIPPPSRTCTYFELGSQYPQQTPFPLVSDLVNLFFFSHRSASGFEAGPILIIEPWECGISMITAILSTFLLRLFGLIEH